jgi:hypothetical protein
MMVMAKNEKKTARLNFQEGQAEPVGPGTIGAGGDGVTQVVQILVYAQASRILNSHRLAIQLLDWGQHPRLAKVLQ